jgi:protein-tyrosine phosphatase
MAANTLTGLPNFRDFGGHPTANGGVVRQGLLFRSQAFHFATEEDLEHLASMEIRLVCDLRSKLERSKSPGRWPQGADPIRLHLDILTDARAGHNDFIDTLRASPNADGVYRGMLVNYRNMPKAFGPVLPGLFSHILEPDNLPAVIHCHAGKDRTGFICAVLLGALGVDREHIFADYLLTAERIDAEQLAIGLADTFSSFVGVQFTRDALTPALEVHREYLAAAFEQLDRDFGGIEQYLEQVAGMTPTKIQALRGILVE